MSHVDYGFSEKEQSYSQSSTFIDRTTSPSRISNVLKGMVISKTEGLARTTLRICTPSSHRSERLLQEQEISAPAPRSSAVP